MEFNSGFKKKDWNVKMCYVYNIYVVFLIIWNGKNIFRYKFC